MLYNIFIPDGYTVHASNVTCPTCGFHIQVETPKPDCWRCPSCGTEHHKAKHIYHVAIRHNKSRIVLTLPKNQESLEFNAQRGRVILRLDGTHPVDVTEHPEPLLKSKIYPLLLTIKLRKLVGEALQCIWGPVRLPFTYHELTAKHMILLTRFIGYTRDFFSDIPFFIGTVNLPRNFKKTGKRLHRASDLPKLMNSIELCKSKTIRKAFYQSPALFFFLNELNIIFRCIGSNVDHFRTIVLETPKANLFEDLAFLCDHPSCIVFYQDFAQAAHISQFIRLLNYPEFLSTCAIGYSTLSEKRRVDVRKTFRKKLNPDDFAIRFSLPLNTAPFEDTTITTSEGCYSFVKVKSISELVGIGKALENCLQHVVPPYR